MSHHATRFMSHCLPVASLVLLATGVAQAATITVDSMADALADDGSCTLREALINSDDDFATWTDCAVGSGADAIVFSSGLFSGSPSSATISLDSGLGRLTTTSSDGLTIAPPLGSTLVIDGDLTHPLMSIGGLGRTASLTDLVFQQGGGATDEALRIDAPGDLTLTRVDFVDNATGGLLVNAFEPGVMSLSSARFEDNTKDGSGFNDSGAALAMMLSDDFDVTIDDTLFQGNVSATRNGGALDIDTSNWIGTSGTAEVAITNSRFRDNRAAFDGGALHAGSNNNDAQFRLVIRDSLFENNRQVQSGRGGAVSLDARDQLAVSALIDRVSFINNDGAAGRGGAVGIADHSVDILNSVFVGNQAARGGAVAYSVASSDVAHPISFVGNTFSDNTASTSGNTIFITLLGSSTPRVYAFSGNAIAPDAGSSPACALESAANLSFTGNGNVVASADCALVAGSTVADPLLAQAMSGDPLKPRVLYPASGSPAIDAWPAADCDDPDGAALTLDHVLNPRPRDGDATGTVDCDAGAFEVGDAGTVSVTVGGGTGSGDVISLPAGIDCGETCDASFPGGQTLVLTAIAASGSVFSGFSGDCTGTDTCTLVVDGNASVDAFFDTAPSHQLAVALDGDGQGSLASSPSGITCAPLCEASFADGSSVTLTASAEFDAVFDGWSGGGCSGTGPCTVVLSADTSVTASFSATAFVLDVGLVGSGGGSVTSSPAGIDCPGDCSELFDRSQTVTLNATPGANSVFLGWEGGACSGTGSCVLDMDNGPYAVDARFETLVPVTVTLGGNGSGSVVSSPAGIDCPGQCSAQMPIGTNLTLTAQADSGSSFSVWSGGCLPTTTNPCSTTLLSAFNTEAVFGAAGFQLTVAVDGAGQVTSSPGGIDCPGDCSEIYSGAQTINLAATPDPGQAFVGWSGVCSGRGDCTLLLGADAMATARFASEDIFANGFEQ